jgi:hypothetical protein
MFSGFGDAPAAPLADDLAPGRHPGPPLRVDPSMTSQVSTVLTRSLFPIVTTSLFLIRSTRLSKHFQLSWINNKSLAATPDISNETAHHNQEFKCMRNFLGSLGLDSV